jgi:hypothetical protein
MRKASSVLLSNDGIERYSPSEQLLFRLLPKNTKPITSTALMAKFFDGRRMSVHGRTVMNVSLTRLKLKVEQNKEQFRIVRSRRRGSKPVEWHVRSLPPR